MANKKKKGLASILRSESANTEIVKEQKPKTVYSSSGGGGLASGLRSASAEKSETVQQRAERKRSNQMRSSALVSIAKTMSKNRASNYKTTLPSVASKLRAQSAAQAPKYKPSSSMASKMKSQTKMQAPKTSVSSSLARNALAPVKNYAKTHGVTGGQGIGSSKPVLGYKKTQVLNPVKQDIQNNYYDAVKKVGMKGSRNERKVYRPLSERDENGQVSQNMRNLENRARGGNRKAQVEEALARTKAKTRTGHTYDEFVNAGINQSGLLPDYILRRKAPTEEELGYRKNYGFDKEAKQAVLDSANKRFLMGLDESYRASKLEDTLKRQYGTELTEDEQAKLDNARDSWAYAGGNMLGQASQFAMTAPLSSLVEGGIMAKAGLKGGKAAIKTTKDALKFAGSRIAADQIVSSPINLLDAMKEDKGADIIKRFGYNQGLDIMFAGFSEIPSFLKNWHFIKGKSINEAANAMEEGTRKLTAKVGAKRELDVAVDETGDVARQEAENIAMGRIGNQRPIANKIEAIQNAEGTVGEFPSTDYAYRIGGERANYDNMRDDMLGAIESQEAIGASEVPNSIGMRAEPTPYKSTRVEKTGVDKVLSDYNTNANDLIARIQDPNFEDTQMLEDIADDLFTVGQRRSIQIDAERAYSDGVRAFSNNPEIDANAPRRAYIDVLKGNIVDELRRSQTPRVADDVAKAVPTEKPKVEVSQEPKAGTPKVESKSSKANNKAQSVDDAADKLVDNWGNGAGDESYKNLVNSYKKMSEDELQREKSVLIKSAKDGNMDVDEVADRTDVIDAIIRDKKNDRSKAAWDEIENIANELRRGKTPNVADDVARAVPAEKPKAETPKVESKSSKANNKAQSVDDATKKLVDNWGNGAGDESYKNLVNSYKKMSEDELQKEKSVLIKSAKDGNMDVDEVADRTDVIDAIIRDKKNDRSKAAWDEIENIAEKEKKPEDLMRKKPNRNENKIPKASDQKVKKEVFNRGESLGKSNAKDTAEKATQEAPKKRNQVKGVLNGEKPNTKYSDMSTAELQAQRHRFEEQTKHDLNAGKSEDEIFKIDEEFARRGEKPKWFEVEPEQGGTKVRSPIEAKRENERLAEKYGKFDNGSTKKVETEDGVKRNSKSVDTMLGYVSPEAEHVVANNMLNGDYARDGKTVEEFVSEVSEKLSDNPHAYMEQLSNFDSKMDARERLVGVEVAQEYAKNTGDVEYETKMIEAYQKIVPEAASVLKIHGILKKASKPARRDLIEKEIAQFEKRFEKRLKRAGIDHLTLKKETREAIINATTREETSKAWAKASIEIWNQIPASLKEKADFIRINAMLFNPKTHIRNVLGNAIFAPMREMKNITGTGLEFIAEKAGIIDKASRTKAIIPDKDGVKYADTVLKEEGDDIRGLSRYMEDLAEGRPFDPKAKLFMAGRENGNPVLNGFRKFADGLGDINSWALEYEDFVFFNKAFKTQYGRTMKARGLTVQDLIDNPKLRNEVTEVATEEALRATYRDESAAARLISRWKNPPKNANAARKAAGLALDAILPFTKTPINILRRALDYSPAGAGKGIYHLARGMHDHNQKMIIKGLDQLASSIPGSGLAMLGWFMAENDHVTSKLGNDKDDQFMKDLGKQNFSIVFNAGKDNEWSYTVDWAAPGCIPFFTGVAFKEMSDEGVDFWETADAFEQMFEPMVEMSVMQGIKNTLETFQRESGGGVVKGLMSAGINTGLQYAGQFKPTLSGQIARTIDPVRRDTTSTAESATKRQIERWVNKQKASIPGLSKTLNPYQNVWGDEENNTYNEDLPMRIIENFFSPGYAKKYKADEVDKEILDLYKKDPSNDKIIPSKLSKYEIGFDGGTVRLSEKDRSNYIKTQGKVSKDVLKSIIKTGEYKDLSLADKQKTFTKTYSDAGAEAKRDTLLKMGKDEWKVYTDDFSGSKKDYKAAKEAGLSAKTYFDIMTKGDKEADRSGNGSLYKSEVVMYLNSKEDLTDEQREILFSKMSTAKNPYTDGTAHTTDWEAEYQSKLEQSEKTENTNLSKAFAGATPREEGSMAAKLFNKSVIERAKEAAENGGSSKGSSRRGRSGRRGGGGSGSSKRKQTASERKFANGTGKLSSVDLEKIYKQTQGKQTKLPTVDLIKIYEQAKIKPAKVPTTSLVKAYTQVQQASKTKTPTPMDIKVKGLTKSQKKAMLKVMLKKLDTKR